MAPLPGVIQIQVHSISVFIGIRTRGSVPMDYGSASGSCSFLQWLSRCQHEIVFLLITVCTVLGTVPAIVFKDNKSLIIQKTVQIKAFYNYGNYGGSGYGTEQIITDPDP
jgi:hypothetical protein